MRKNVERTLKRKHNKIKIIDSSYVGTVHALFHENGYEVVKENPDLVVFTGGEDISSSFYNERHYMNGREDSLSRRDRVEQDAFIQYLDVPKVGICRGGQLMNVLSGGSMWQHVNGHHSGHYVVDLLNLFDRQNLYLNSCHHQMMIPGDKAELIAFTEKAQSNQYLSGPGIDRADPEVEPEVIYYEHTKSLCFQAHPEWTPQDSDCNNYFFELINRLL